MAGYIHITRAGAATGTYGASALPEYQLTYVTGGNSFVRTFSDAGMEEFLASYIGLTADEAAAAIDRVRLHGNATIPEVGLSEQTAAALGLTQLPSDY